MIKVDRQATGDSLLRLEAALSQLEDQIDEMQVEINHLEAAGMINASEWWKDRKYLYLVHPVDPVGNRRRVYVGNDPQNVADAQAAIKRYEQWDKLQTKIRVLRDRHASTLSSLDRLAYLLSAKQLPLWRTE